MEPGNFIVVTLCHLVWTFWLNGEIFTLLRCVGGMYYWLEICQTVNNEIAGHITNTASRDRSLLVKSTTLQAGPCNIPMLIMLQNPGTNIWVHHICHILCHDLRLDSRSFVVRCCNSVSRCKILHFCCGISFQQKSTAVKVFNYPLMMLEMNPHKYNEPSTIHTQKHMFVKT